MDIHGLKNRASACPVFHVYKHLPSFWKLYYKMPAFCGLKHCSCMHKRVKCTKNTPIFIAINVLDGPKL